MIEERQYHHVKIKPDEGYDKIRTITFGDGIKALIGIKGGKTTVITLLFDKDDYSPGEAKAWAKEHGDKVLKTQKAESMGSFLEAVTAFQTLCERAYDWTGDKSEVMDLEPTGDGFWVIINGRRTRHITKGDAKKLKSKLCRR